MALPIYASPAERGWYYAFRFICAMIWKDGVWVNAAKNSVIVGFFATILATFLGTLAALGLSRPEMPYRRAIMAILISPMIVPVIIITLGLFFFYSSIEVNKWGVPYL